MSRIRLECPACEAFFEDDSAVADQTGKLQSLCPECGFSVPHTEENVSIAQNRQAPVSTPNAPQSKPLPTPQRVADRRGLNAPPAFTSTHDTGAKERTPKQRKLARPAGQAAASSQPKVARPARKSQSSSTHEGVVIGSSNAIPSMLEDSDDQPISGGTQSASNGGLTRSNAIPSASEIARRKSGSRILALTFMVGVTAVAIGAAAFFLREAFSPEVDDDSAIAEVDSDDVDDEASHDEVETVEDSIARGPVPLTEEQTESLLASATPYFVKVTAGGRNETRTGSGILIDTRGWVATPLTLIAGAVYVDVEFPNPSSNEGAAVTRKLRSTGALSFSPELDLAIIRIPGDMIEPTVDIAPSIDAFPIKGAQLAVMHLDDANEHVTLTGCEVNGHWTRRAIGIGEQNAGLNGTNNLGTNGIDATPTSATLTSVTRPNATTSTGAGAHNLFTSQADASDEAETEAPNAQTSLIEISISVNQDHLGSPLLRPDGALNGMVVQSPRGTTGGHAVSIDAIQRLRTVTEESLVAFDAANIQSAAQTVGRQWNIDSFVADNQNAAGMAANAQAEPGTVGSRAYLEQLATRCESFDWLPQSANELGALQELARYLVAAEEVAVDEEAEEGTRLLLEQTAATIRQKLSQTEWAADEQLAAMNHLAIESFSGDDKGVYCFVQVEHPPGIVSFDDQSTVVMKLIGTDHRIVLPVTRAFESLSVGSEWLVVGTRGRTLQIEESDGSRSQAPIVFTIYLIERPERIAWRSNDSSPFDGTPLRVIPFDAIPVLSL